MNYYIEEYMGDMIIKLTGDINKDMTLIKELCNNKRDKEINLELVKDKISIKNVIDEFINA